MDADALVAGTCLFNAQLCALIVLAILSQRRKFITHYLLIGQVVCASILCATAWMLLKPEWQTFRGTFYLYIPAMYVIGPMTFCYVNSFLDENYSFGRRELLCFIIPIITVIAAPLLYVLDGMPDIAMAGQYYRTGRLTLADKIVIGALVQDMIFYLLVLRQLIVFFRPAGLARPLAISVITGFMLLCVVISGLGLLSVVFQKLILMGLAGATMGVALILILLAAQRHPTLVEGLRDFVAENLVTPESLAGVDERALGRKFSYAMDEEKSYCEGDLSLGSLAQRLGVSRNQLSAFINQTYKKNFKTILNEYRVTAAKEMLLQEADLPIIRVALKVGFNSKSSFNTIFARATGQTPSDFRKKLVIDRGAANASLRPE